MKNIAKKIATTILAFALALVSIFTYNPLVVNATSSSDLALGFVDEVTITKPHTLVVYYQEDLTDSYAITKIVIESNYPMRFYASGSFFSAVINSSYGVWKEFLNFVN